MSKYGVPLQMLGIFLEALFCTALSENASVCGAAWYRVVKRPLQKSAAFLDQILMGRTLRRAISDNQVPRLLPRRRRPHPRLPLRLLALRPRPVHYHQHRHPVRHVRRRSGRRPRPDRRHHRYPRPIERRNPSNLCKIFVTHKLILFYKKFIYLVFSLRESSIKLFFVRLVSTPTHYEHDMMTNH